MPRSIEHNDNQVVNVAVQTLGNGAEVVLDGRIEIDSNTVERTMRPIGLGRRNYLFAGSDEGGRTWAIIASLINSAKLYGIDPQEYLTDVLERIVSGRSKINQLEELLPWRWKAARQVAAVKAAA